MLNQQSTRNIILLSCIVFLFSASKLCNAQTEIKIPQDSLPNAVQDNLHKKYSDYHVNSITKNSSKQPVIYSLELQKKNRLIRLVYDMNGNIIEKNKSKIFTFDGTEPIKSAPVQSNDGHNHQH